MVILLGNVLFFNEGDICPLSTVDLSSHTVTYMGPKYSIASRVMRRLNNVSTVELPHRIRTYPTFYMGRLRPYFQ